MSGSWLSSSGWKEARMSRQGSMQDRGAQVLRHRRACSMRTRCCIRVLRATASSWARVAKLEDKKIEITKKFYLKKKTRGKFTGRGPSCEFFKFFFLHRKLKMLTGIGDTGITRFRRRSLLLSHGGLLLRNFTLVSLRNVGFGLSLAIARAGTLARFTELHVNGAIRTRQSGLFEKPFV